MGLLDENQIDALEAAITEYGFSTEPGGANHEVEGADDTYQNQVAALQEIKGQRFVLSADDVADYVDGESTYTAEELLAEVLQYIDGWLEGMVSGAANALQARGYIPPLTDQ